MKGDGNYLLSWDLFESNRTSTLKTLRENEDFLDVTIVCDDDQVDAHKVILSAASPFFHKILTRNPHNHPLLYLRGTTKKDVKSLLDFIYSGETQVPHEELDEFMALASSLQVKGLVAEDSFDIDTFTEELRIKNEKVDEPILRSNKNKLKTRKKPSGRGIGKLEMNDVQNVKIVDDTEDISEIETQVDDDIVENRESIEQQNTANTSKTEYNERVLELLTKGENGWQCTECTYITKYKNHAQEHVERHIEGYSHECELCEKTFNKRRSLRHHKIRQH